MKLTTIRTIVALFALLGSAIPLHAQGTPMPAPYQTVLDNSGNIVSAACVWTYSAGTSTAAATYTDAALSVANSNPIIADSAGRFVAYLSPGASYKFVYENTPCSAISHGTTLKTVDNVPTVPPTTINNDVTGTAGEALTAGQLVYLSDGSGSKTAGQWFKADNGQAYSSINPILGFAVASVASGAAGTIRVAGRITGLTSLVVGSTYGVGAAGALTASAFEGYTVRNVGVADTTTSLIFTPDPPIPAVDNRLCEARLTLTTGTAVTTADVTAATTVYLTPYRGNRIALFDTQRWYLRELTADASIAVPATTNQMYDVFAYDNATAVALELVAWTNDTTRATALTLRNGVYVKTGDSTRRYLGSFRTTGVSGQTEDSLAKRYVWNYYNRVPRPVSVTEATDTWTYTTATWRQARATATNQVEVVVGVQEVAISLQLQASVSNTNTGVGVGTAIGEDSTSAPLTGSLVTTQTTALANGVLVNVARLTKYPAVGRHFYAWLEISVATGATTWYGDNGGANTQSGVSGTIEG